MSLLNKFLKRELHEMIKPPAEKKITKTRTYYVNAFNCKNSAGQDSCMIGLFESNMWSGITGFGVKIGKEYYVNTKLLAFYRIKPHPFTVNFHNRCGDVKICGKNYDKIPIISRHKEKRLEADCVESAIEKFTNFQFD